MSAYYHFFRILLGSGEINAMHFQGNLQQKNCRQSQKNKEPATVRHSRDHDAGANGRVAAEFAQGQRNQYAEQRGEQQVQHQRQSHDQAEFGVLVDGEGE